MPGNKNSGRKPGGTNKYCKWPMHCRKCKIILHTGNASKRGPNKKFEGTCRDCAKDRILKLQVAKLPNAEIEKAVKNYQRILNIYKTELKKRGGY